MERRKFSREFKFEAVKLVRDRGVASAQATRDLGVHANVLRKWVREPETDPVQAFPGYGQMKPEQLEIDRLRKEVAKIRAKRDIRKRVSQRAPLVRAPWRTPTSRRIEGLTAIGPKEGRDT